MVEIRQSEVLIFFKKWETENDKQILKWFGSQKTVYGICIFN